MASKLDRIIHVVAGYHPDLPQLEAPLWTGTVSEFWEKNQHLLWGDICDLIRASELVGGFTSGYQMGGGAEPEVKILSEASRVENIRWIKAHPDA